MTIDELKEKHRRIIAESDLHIPEYFEDVINYTEEENSTAENAKNLSLQFAIELLEELSQCWIGTSKVIYVEDIEMLIDKLKESKV